MLDFHACHWTSTPGLSPEDESIAEHFDALNEPAFSAALRVRARGGGGERDGVAGWNGRVELCHKALLQTEPAAGSSINLPFCSLLPPQHACPQKIEAQAAAAGGRRPPVISFSHFLPRQELLPEKRML